MTVRLFGEGNGTPLQYSCINCQHPSYPEGFQPLQLLQLDAYLSSGGSWQIWIWTPLWGPTVANRQSYWEGEVVEGTRRVLFISDKDLRMVYSLGSLDSALSFLIFLLSLPLLHIHTAWEAWRLRLCVQRGGGACGKGLSQTMTPPPTRRGRWALEKSESWLLVTKPFFAPLGVFLACLVQLWKWAGVSLAWFSCSVLFRRKTARAYAARRRRKKTKQNKISSGESCYYRLSRVSERLLNLVGLTNPRARGCGLKSQGNATPPTCSEHQAHVCKGFLEIQWLGLRACTARSTGLILGGGTKIPPHMLWGTALAPCLPSSPQPLTTWLLPPVQGPSSGNALGPQPPSPPPWRASPPDVCDCITQTLPCLPEHWLTGHSIDSTCLT